MSERRTLVTVSGHAVHMRIPWSDYPHGRTVGWARCRPSDRLWEVRILDGPGAGICTADDRATAEQLLWQRTREVAHR